MLAQFGKKWTVCPNCSRRAPELAAGKLDEVLADLWQDSEADLVLHTAQIYGLDVAGRISEGAIYIEGGG